jgi:hypothetical protein
VLLAVDLDGHLLDPKVELQLFGAVEAFSHGSSPWGRASRAS